MGTLTKVFVIINLVFSVALVMVSATALSQRVHWKQMSSNIQSEYNTGKQKWQVKEIGYKDDQDRMRAQRDTAEATAIQRQDQLTTMGNTMRERDASVSKLEKDIAAAHAHSDRLSQNVDRLTKDLSSTQTELERLKGELVTARRELDDRNTTLVGIRSTLAAVELRHKELLHRYNIASEMVDEYQKYREYVKDRAPDLPPPEGLAEPIAPPKPIHAAVRAVNAEIGVVVLNVGSNNRAASGEENPVKKGYRFLIYRGRQFVAAVKVANVEKDMCAAELVPPPGDPNVAVQVGDDAMTAP